MTDLYGDVNVLETTVITPEGAVMKVYRVSARTKSKVAFTLDIDEKDFTAEKVSKALTDKAALIESVKKL